MNLNFNKNLVLGVLLLLLACMGGLYFIIPLDVGSSNYSFSDQTVNRDVKDVSQQGLVYLTGAVENPGLYALEGEKNIQALVTSAGGLLPYADTKAINLAEPLEVGAHIHIPFNFTGNPENLLRKPVININQASEEELTALPGVGKALAKRIVDHRNSQGPFKTIEDIKQVKGIGDGLFKKWAQKITV